MKRHFKCFDSRINCGLKYSRCDVVGIRDVGGELSGETETICIEVKRGTEPFATASGQALGYRVYGNRVYLADVRANKFSNDELAIASTLGIGLIHISKKMHCTEVLSSPYYNPMTRLNLLLLQRMAIAQCRLCGTFFRTGDENNRNKFVTRENLKNAIKYEKGMIFWNWDLGQRKAKLGIEHTKGTTTWERRYICPDCISRVLIQIVPSDWTE
ncbi:MAG: hypothetical protein GC164_02900 [Phycisphaera sp.]|nr:hypothetical protein [Phycisphaera sp.]